MLRIHTAKIGKAEGLDITVKAGSIFGPTWDIVGKVKKGLMTEAQYIEKYTALMRESYKKHRPVWDEILAKESITLLCYCPPRTFCHRVLLAEMLVKASKGNAIYVGEKH